MLTGVQAHNDLDGSVGPLLAAYPGHALRWLRSRCDGEQWQRCVRKEYPGGLIAEMEVTLPAVLGIQAAEEPPRYVAIQQDPPGDEDCGHRGAGLPIWIPVAA